MSVSFVGNILSRLREWRSGHARQASIPIPIAISARHAHLAPQTIEKLFGEGYQLTFRAALSQPGHYAAQETVTLVGPRGRIENVRLIGPPRNEDQVELSRSDEVMLGIEAPLRVSGDLRETPGLQIVGPKGSVQLQHGVVRPVRHIHMSPDDARRFGVQDRDRVSVRIDSDGRDLEFGDVIVRVDPSYRLELHLDTDEGNAAGVREGVTATLSRITR
jgi:acetate kinase